MMPHFHCSNSIAKDLHFTATRLSVTLEWYIYCEYVGSGDKDPWHLSKILGSGSLGASNRPGPARQPYSGLAMPRLARIRFLAQALANAGAMA